MLPQAVPLPVLPQATTTTNLSTPVLRRVDTTQITPTAQVSIRVAQHTMSTTTRPLPASSKPRKKLAHASLVSPELAQARPTTTTALEPLSTSLNPSPSIRTSLSPSTRTSYRLATRTAVRRVVSWESSSARFQDPARVLNRAMVSKAILLAV